MLSKKLLNIVKIARIYGYRNYESIGCSKVPVATETADAPVPVYKAEEYDGSFRVHHFSHY